jgi:hypothetical protein
MLAKTLRRLSSRKHIEESARLLLEYLSLRSWDGGGLRRGAVSGEARRAFIPSLSGLLYAMKLEAMLGKALQLNGVRPVIILRQRAWWPERFFGAFGITDFVYLDDLPLTSADRDEAHAFAESRVRGAVTLALVKTWTHEGAPVGQYALSTLARMQRKGMPDLASEQTLSALRAELARTVLNMIQARRLVASLGEGACWLFNEVNYSDYGPVFYAAFQARNNVIQFGHALRDCALIFKRLTHETYRIHPNSVSRDTLDTVRGQPWTESHLRALAAEFDGRYGGKSWFYRRDQEGTQMKDKVEVRRQLALDPAKRTVVVYSHILWDANLFYGDDLFDDNEHWFIETLKAACANDRVNWLVKLHPAIKWKMAWDGAAGELNEDAAIRRHLGALPDHVKLLYPDTDINTYSLLSLTDVGVTIRGTVGIELACRGVPVVTAGTGRYSGLGFTLDPASRAEYLALLARVDEVTPLAPAQLDLARRYAYTLFCLRPWQMTSFANAYDTAVRGFSHFNPSLRLRARSFKELEQAADLRKFAHWAVQESAVDYLEPWPAP